MYAKIGRISTSTSGANPFRADYLGGLITSNAGDYKDTTLGNRMYFAFALDTAVALYTATAAIGLQIYNPISSQVNLVIHKWAYIVRTTATTTTGGVLAVTPQPLLAPTSPVSSTLQGRTLLTGTTGLQGGSCMATTTCTLATAPVVCWPLFHNTAAINTVGAEIISGDLQGAFAFAPGMVAVFAVLGAAGTNVSIGCTYEEVPLGL